MTVKVVTDSTADIPAEIARDLGITVIPLYVAFGEKVRRDGVEITADQFYSELTGSTVLPKTSQPSVGDFQALYDRLSDKTDEILSIHISAKLSGTVESAMSARKLIKKRCRVEIIDSKLASMAVGLIVMKAARLAKSGAKLDDLVQQVNALMPRTFLFGALDTLEYLRKGGRIGKAAALLGSLLNVKPFVIVKDGEVHPLERVRGASKVVPRLKSLVQEHQPVDELAIMYSTTPEQARSLAADVSGLVPKDNIHVARFGPVLGVYVGPGCLGLALVKKT